MNLLWGRKQFRLIFLQMKNGLIGRECPKCNMYFKIKPGTGLQISYHICPYCKYRGDNNEFFTQDQIEYAKSIAIKTVMDPFLDTLDKTFKKMERATKGGFIQIKVRTSGSKFKIKKYHEKVLETYVTCDNCGCVFSIYGVFSNCPDCSKINIKAIFNKSIEVAKNMLKLTELDEFPIKEELIISALIGTVSSFDSFGKELRKKHKSKFPPNPKNLFQNFKLLDKTLKKTFGKNIENYLSKEDSHFLFKMFQVRHIYEHCSGVIDEDFIKNLPEFKNRKGRKFILKNEEIQLFIEKIQQLATKIYSEVE